MDLLLFLIIIINQASVSWVSVISLSFVRISDFSRPSDLVLREDAHHLLVKQGYGCKQVMPRVTLSTIPSQSHLRAALVGVG